MVGSTGVNIGFSKSFLNFFDGWRKLVSFVSIYFTSFLVAFSLDIIFVLKRTRESKFSIYQV